MCKEGECLAVQPNVLLLECATRRLYDANCFLIALSRSYMASVHRSPRMRLRCEAAGGTQAHGGKHTAALGGALAHGREGGARARCAKKMMAGKFEYGHFFGGARQRRTSPRVR